MMNFVPKFFFGANLKQLQIRMRSVGSIAKITKAMKMVATAKMKIEMRRLDAGKAFAVGSVQKMLDNENYLQKKKQQDGVVKKTLLVPMTSDKGLCGSSNSGISRFTRNIVVEEGRDNFKVLCVGDKGTAALNRMVGNILFASIHQVAIPMTFPTASSIAHQITEHSKDCQKISVIYNRFKNVITQIVTRVDIQTRDQFVKQFKLVNRHEAVEPDLEYSKHYFYELYVASIVYHAFLNNAASEQASRMNAMGNASKNAREMLDKLTLQFNKARQQKITMELIEIISGAAAV